MKHIITIVLLLITISSFAQIHKAFPVKELDSLARKDTSAFKHHPIWLDVTVNYVSNFTAYKIDAVTTYNEDISHTPYYTSKITQTYATLVIPTTAIAFTGTINSSGTLNITAINQILKLFDLQYDSSSQLIAQ
jgi:hypothetical protein